MTLHIDTDIGSDTDDLCAIAMLMGLDVPISAITTSAEHGGARVGFVDHLYRLARRPPPPIATGAAHSLSGFEIPPELADVDRYWPSAVPSPRETGPGLALQLLDQSIASGAVIVVLGPATNLALLEIMRPGRLAAARQIVFVGGEIREPRPGLPALGAAHDYNVLQDRRAAASLLTSDTSLVLVPPSTALLCPLRESHLAALTGPVGRVLAHQGLEHADEYDMRALGRRFAGLPPDLLNFQFDAVGCAVAAGLIPAHASRTAVVAASDGWRQDPSGMECAVIHDVDAPAFEQLWLDAIASLDAQTLKP